MPVPKTSRPGRPNDCRPVALTSHVMKSFAFFLQNHDHEPYRPSVRSSVICISAWERGGGWSRYSNKQRQSFKKLISGFKLESAMALFA